MPFVFAYPGNLNTPTGGYAYDREIIARLPAHGCAPKLVSLGEGFPYPCASTRKQAEKLLLANAPGELTVVDGLALGVLPDTARRVSQRSALIGLVHHPLAHETGVDKTREKTLRESERVALGAARRVITTSAFTSGLLQREYDVPAKKITVVLPGCQASALARQRPFRAGARSEHIQLLAVGSLVPRKGYDVLVRALADLTEVPWHLTIVGERRDPNTAANIAKLIREQALESRINLVGAVSDQRLDEFYAQTDVFVLASHFEGYGMAFAEAMARGLPIVATTGGAISETVPDNAGLLVAPGDAAAFSAALRRVLTDATLRQNLSAGARDVASRLPTWDDAARQFASVIRSVA